MERQEIFACIGLFRGSRGRRNLPLSGFRVAESVKRGFSEFGIARSRHGSRCTLKTVTEMIGKITGNFC
jgi:hypothetical protein